MDRKYWTSLEDLQAADEPRPSESDVRSLLENLPAVDRRSFLKLVGMSFAVGALSGCRRPVEKIIPYLNQPAEVAPGAASWYATTCHGCSAACGALARVMDGRPVKLEGNPDHGRTRGGLCAVGQGAVLGLYDAYRQKTPAIGGESVSWERVDQEIGGKLAAARQQRRKVVLLTGTITGPATRALIAEFLAGFPGGEHVVYDPVPYDAIRLAHARAYGQPLIPAYRFEQAAVIVSFGADFLGTWLSPVEFTKGYAAGRNLVAPNSPMSRHFQFESRLSLTGSNADRRVAIAPSEQAACLARLAALVAREAGSGAVGRALAAAKLPEVQPAVQEALAGAARALLGARGRSLVVVDSDDPATQLLALTLNELLGNVGRTVDLSRPSLQKQGSHADMARLIEEMRAGQVGVLLIHGGNPAYTWPEAEAFVAALKRVPCSVSFATVPDETAAATRYHCPAHHPMEAWGDAEPQAGRLSLFQPTIQPLYQTRAFEDTLLRWSGKPGTFHDYLKEHWRTRLFPRQREAGDFVAFWDTLLQRGYVELPVATPTLSPLRPAVVADAAGQVARRERPSGPEVQLFETVALREGMEANNPWLQELPDPITKITWGNYAAIAPALAREQQIEEGQPVQVTVGGRSLRLPAHIQPGQHPRTISIPLGYGRTAAGPVGNGSARAPFRSWQGQRVPPWRACRMRRPSPWRAPRFTTRWKAGR